MPYIVRQAVRNGPKRYTRGDFYPGEKGSLPDMEAVGAIEWVKAGPRHAEPMEPLADEAPQQAAEKPQAPPKAKTHDTRKPKAVKS